MKTATSLFLVGEYALFRECLAAKLAAAGFTVVGQSPALTDARDVGPEVVLYDAGRSSVAALAEIRDFSESFEGKLVVLGVDEVEEEILRFIEAGAAAYVLKEVSVEELVRTLERLADGEAVCSPKLALSMFSRLAHLARTRRREESFESLDLTVRELEILRLVARGLSNKEIARDLCLSFHTVKNHVHNILDKLKVEHRSQAVDYAYRKRWLPPREGEPSRPSTF